MNAFFLDHLVTIELDPVKANPERFRYDSFSETNETVPEQSRIKMPPDPKDVLSKCPEFECSNGNCVQHYYICDGTDDCLDNSDEVNCDKHGCDYDEYRCPSGKCISAEWICDQVLDCPNGEDELNCSY
ncbi:Atrial natriuretic peptide-converting enzyme [Halotydeus destructor]|nr:Atrial natriuretic peptide-converting enzyme [Halotydeus destructor]